MMASWIIYCAVLVCLLDSISAKIQCIGEKGKPVDWYVLYKLPTSKKSNSNTIRDGVGYMYISSEDRQPEWKLSTFSVNNTDSIPARSLAPIYSGSNKVLFGLYNDQPPFGSPALTFGHTKGVVVSDGETGLWLIHSVPGFPMNPFDPKTNETFTYSYPKTATRFGQSFFCISMSAAQLDTVGYQLMYNKPKFYSKNVPDDFKMFPNLTRALSNGYIKKAPWSSTVELQSLAGVRYTSFAKAAKFGQDLYSDLVAPGLESDLQVETWSNGPGEFPSDCKSKYHVMDIAELDVRNKGEDDLAFKNSQDHSKWAITDEEKSFVCVGDINRMLAQLKRGGGTLCVKNKDLWGQYTKLISAVQPCSLPGSTTSSTPETTTTAAPVTKRKKPKKPRESVVTAAPVNENYNIEYTQKQGG